MLLKRTLSQALFNSFITSNKIIILESQLLPKNQLFNGFNLTKYSVIGWELSSILKSNAFLSFPLRVYCFGNAETKQIHGLLSGKSTTTDAGSIALLKFNNLVFIKTCAKLSTLLNRPLIEKRLFRLLTSSTYFFLKGLHF